MSNENVVLRQQLAKEKTIKREMNTKASQDLKAKNKTIHRLRKKVKSLRKSLKKGKGKGKGKAKAVLVNDVISSSNFNGKTTARIR